MESHLCLRCDKTKPASEFNTNRYPGNEGDWGLVKVIAGRGVQAWCRECSRTYDRIRDKVRAGVKNANVAARKLGLAATLTLEEWHELLDEYNHLCAYCKESPATEVDHYVPLSKGGPSVKSNIRPSCRSCNRSKGNSDPEVWLASRVAVVV